MGKYLSIRGLKTVDTVQYRSHSLDVHKVDSLTIDVSQLANGTIPEPVFSGELSVLSSVDPEDEAEWVCASISDRFID